MRIASTLLPRGLDPSPVRVWSLVATLYGDAVLPRGGQLWLGTVTALLSELAIEPDAVRAAMSRLARDGFLTRERAGRTSHYKLSPLAERESRAVARLVYRRTAPALEPGWSFAVINKAPPEDTALLERAGFLSASPGLHARPGRGARPPVGLGFDAAGNGGAEDRALAARLYPLADLAARYREFSSACAEVATDADALGPLDAMTLRLVVTHSFRRIILRSPHLHPTALPADWPADEAHAEFATLYGSLFTRSERWLDEEGLNAAGSLPPATDTTRFAEGESAKM